MLAGVRPFADPFDAGTGYWVATERVGGRADSGGPLLRHIPPVETAGGCARGPILNKYIIASVDWGVCHSELGARNPLYPSCIILVASGTIVVSIGLDSVLEQGVVCQAVDSDPVTRPDIV